MIVALLALLAVPARAVPPAYKAVGAKLNEMMAMGVSRPRPDALEAATGQAVGWAAV